MKILTLLLALSASVSAINISHIPVVEDSKKFLSKGYNNSNMSSNGELAILASIEQGDVVFDVGANVGEWSLYALESSPDITLYSFEPLPTAFKKLQKSLDGYAACYNSAISDSNGSMTFYYYPKAPTLSSFHRRSRSIERRLRIQPKRISVSRITLDDFCEENAVERIDLLKIDTEGHELFIFKGGEKLLENGQIQVIQFEYGGCNLDSNTTIKDLFEVLQRHGYEIYRIWSGGLIHTPKWHKGLECFKYSNYIAVKH